MILHRNTHDEFSHVVPEWQGKTAVVIGGGPSLTKAQIELVQTARMADTVRVIAVNDAYLAAHWSDVLYAADSQWWNWSAHGTEKPLLCLTKAQTRVLFETFAGQRCSIQNSGSNIIDAAVHKLRNKTFPYHGTGISLEPDRLITARNSGFQALNLAILAGARTVILLGMDGQPGRDGRTHCHGGHPEPTNPQVWSQIRQGFSAAENAIAAAGVRVLNCAPGSAIGFERMELADALNL